MSDIIMKEVKKHERAKYNKGQKKEEMNRDPTTIFKKYARDKNTKRNLIKCSLTVKAVDIYSYFLSMFLLERKGNCIFIFKMF